MSEDFIKHFTKLLSKPIIKSENSTEFKKVESGWVPNITQPTTKLLFSSDIMEKGKSAQIGEIREWKGQKYKKDVSGRWVPVTGDKHKGVDSEEAHKKRGFNKETGDEDVTGQSEDLLSKLSEEEISKYARSAKTESLERHSKGGDEKMRVAAKAELSRREKEENPDNEGTVLGEDGKSKDIKENKEKGSSLTIEQKGEKLSSDYKKTTESLMDPDIYSKVGEAETLSIKQREIARYIRRIKEFEGVDQEQAKSESLKKLELSTDNELQEFVGDGKILAMKKSFGSLSFLTEDCYCQIQVDQGGKEIHLEELLLDIDVEKGKGKGTEIFGNQVESFKTQGFKSIGLTAAKSDTYNGYYTWAVLGFEMDTPTDKKEFKALVKNSDNPKIQNCKKLSELISFKEGADFWRKVGFSFEGKFDLKDNSNSMKLLKSYMDKKKTA